MIIIHFIHFSTFYNIRVFVFPAYKFFKHHSYFKQKIKHKTLDEIILRRIKIINCIDEKTKTNVIVF